VLADFTATSDNVIPTDLLERAHGIAVIPDVIRGGFILGARRGKGVLTIRTENGEWSNPAFVALTGGSIGWQIGAESTDLVLVFANERAIRNIASGKFTLGGDASAVAGALGRRTTAAVTFRSEVYAFVQSTGLFAGAALEGARIGLDSAANQSFYEADSDTVALERQTPATPASARRFLLSLERAAAQRPAPGRREEPPPEQAKTFPLE
jgi:lipid-binding SYLF domain-containing protein